MDFVGLLSTIPWLPTVVILTIATLAYLYFLLASSKSKNHEAPPPPQAGGAWPIIGHLHLLGGPRPPHRVLSHMAEKHGLMFTIRMGVHSALVVSNWETAKECLTTHDRVFADRPATLTTYILGYNRSMFGFSPYGAYWRQIRKMATLELLSTHRLDSLTRARESEVQVATRELYTCWAEKKKEQKGDRSGAVSVEMTSWFGEITLNVILKMIVWKSVGYLTGGENGVRLRRILKDFFHLSGRFVVADGLPFLRWLDVGGFEKAMRKTAVEMDVVVGEWLTEHKAKRERDSSGDGEVIKAEEDFMDVILNVVGDAGGIEGGDPDTVNKATCLGHISAKISHKERLIKYLFKFPTKGPGRSMVQVTNARKTSSDVQGRTDGIASVNGHYISAHELAWRASPPGK